MFDKTGDTRLGTFKERLNNCRIGIRYDKQFRNYAIKQRYMSGFNAISHCPWCGAKFPTDLSSQWDSILLNEYNLDNPFNSKQAKLIPAEFLTDEWWKKRGL